MDWQYRERYPIPKWRHMSDETNPFESGRLDNPSLQVPRPVRPLGTLVVAALLIVANAVLLTFLFQRYVMPAAQGAQFGWTAGAFSRFIHQWILAISGVIAIVGLVAGKRFGWWITLIHLYLRWSDDLILRKLFHETTRTSELSRIVGNVAASFLLFGLLIGYMNDPNVRAYFGIKASPVWLFNLTMALVAAIVTIGTIFI